MVLRLFGAAPKGGSNSAEDNIMRWYSLGALGFSMLMVACSGNDGETGRPEHRVPPDQVAASVRRARQARLARRGPLAPQVWPAQLGQWESPARAEAPVPRAPRD